MSASSSTLRHTPYLPPELWLEILQFATHVPGALDINPPDPFALPRPPSEQEIKRAITRSLVTKRYIVLVCKQWYHAAISSLYAIIVLNNGRGILSLYNTLRLSQSQAEADASTSDSLVHPLGWYTKRIDVVMHDSQTRHRHGEEAEQIGICGVLECLPNLAFFIAHVKRRGWEASRVARCLAATAGPSLRCIQWVNRTFVDHLCPNQESWQALLLACPNLHTLEVPACKSTSPVLLPKDSNLSSLAIFGGPYAKRDHLQFDLPSLSSLKFYTVPFGVCTLQDTLSLYGKYLTTLAIHFTTLGDINVLHEHCPNLKRLVLCMDKWASLPEQLRLPPSVTHLGIAFDELRPRLADYVTVFLHLSEMTAPGVVVLRMLGNHPLLRDHCCRFPKLAKAMETLRIAGFKLEDRDGQAFA